MAWLNSQDIKQARSLTEFKSQDPSSKRPRRWSHSLCDFYILADSILAPGFGNAIADIIVAWLKEFEAEDKTTHDEDKEGKEQWGERAYRDPFESKFPKREVRQMLSTLLYQIQRMYIKTKTDSPLRKMLVDKIIQQGTKHDDYYENLRGILDEGVPLEFYHP
ncbi:hypothetical protein EAF04_010833 [Stromatinia cepivora]|nr:hypothetical protein EAF04_010833 [Stromatinia cepivora]